MTAKELARAYFELTEDFHPEIVKVIQDNYDYLEVGEELVAEFKNRYYDD